MTKSLRPILLLPWFLLLHLPAAAGPDSGTIYAYADDTGAVSLSNVPTSRRYKPLVTDPLPGAAAATSDERSAPRGTFARTRFDDMIDQTAKTYGLESALLHAVISVESGYDPAALSPKGAAGLMQLMPVTAKRYGVADAMDPAQNVQGGARYLRDLEKQFHSDLSLVLAAYHAGETAVARYDNRIPPFRDTADYVPRVLANYRKYQANRAELE